MPINESHRAHVGRYEPCACCALRSASPDAHGPATAKRALSGELWAGSQFAAGSLTAGVGQVWEAAICLDRFGADPGRPTASLAYYYLSPIADITPGISAGMLDVANATADGRRVYACATMNRSVPKLAQFGYTELTAGVEVGRRIGPMAGFRTPIARGFSALAEYDGFRFNAGVEAKLGGGEYLRLATRAGVPYLVLGFRQ
jgi:hypothetical protein